LSNPYNYQSTDDGDYKFTTESGVEYTCFFVEPIDGTLLGLELESTVQMFNIYPVDKKADLGTGDDRIGDTTAELLNEAFANSHQNVIGYICDSDDPRAESRHRKFRIWFSLYNKTKSKKLYTLCVSDTLYAGIITENNHPEHSVISSFINSEVEEMIVLGKPVSNTVSH
jgi:hypothetical protein